MITTIRVTSTFSPTRTLTIAAGASVDFWSMQPQRGVPEKTRKPASAITRQFSKVASIDHKGKWLTASGERIEWRPHGSAFVQIVGGDDDKLWVAANAAGVTADVTPPAGCTTTDCSGQYDAGYDAGRAATEAGWQSWANLMATGGGEEVAGGTATVTSVPDTAAASTALLVANANRLAFRVQNESQYPLYLKFGTAASATSYTVMIPAGGFYAEDGYSGIVHGIWSADGTGSARITEITP